MVKAYKYFITMPLVKFLILLLILISASVQADCVILLHGLARTSSSMEKIANALEEKKFSVVNVDYPSRKHPISELATMAIESGLKDCPQDGNKHFVTHSLGGILIRQYLSNKKIKNLGRVIMIAPPNQGSEVVDNWRNVPGFKTLNGPAGLQLGTDKESIPRQLGPVDFEVGIIAGNTTFNPILSLSLPNPDDGKVSVESTKVKGMSDFVVVPHSHPFIMRASIVIEHVLSFLKTGRFVRDEK